MAKHKNRQTGEETYSGEVPMHPDIPGINVAGINAPIEDDPATDRNPEIACDVTAELSIPIAADVPSEFPIHLDVTLSPPAATVLRRIALALDRQQAVTSDGQRVVRPSQALRYLLEQMRTNS